jgi:hypothetical protein
VIRLSATISARRSLLLMASKKAERRLSVGRSTLFDKIRKFDIRSGVRLRALSREPLG